MTAQFPLSGPMTVGDLLDRAFRLYRARFGPFLLTAAISLVPAGILAFLPLDESIRYPIAVLWYLPARVISTLVLAVHVIEALHNRSVTTWEGIRLGLRRFWPYVGMTIVRWAAVLAATAVAVIPPVLGLMALEFLVGDWMDGFGNALWEIGLYNFATFSMAILILSPGVYLYARWLAAPAALIGEGSGPMDSLRRSWHLSAGSVRHSAGYVVLLGLLTTILPYVTEKTLEWIFELILPAGASELTLQFLISEFTYILSIFGLPFEVTAVVLLYYDLRIRNEGYDLELRLAELEARVAEEVDLDRVASDAGAGRGD